MRYRDQAKSACVPIRQLLHHIRDQLLQEYIQGHFLAEDLGHVKIAPQQVLPSFVAVRKGLVHEDHVAATHIKFAQNLEVSRAEAGQIVLVEIRQIDVPRQFLLAEELQFFLKVQRHPHRRGAGCMLTETSVQLDRF